MWIIRRGFDGFSFDVATLPAHTTAISLHQHAYHCIKVKIRLSLSTPRKYGRGIDVLPSSSFWTFALNGGEWSTSHLSHSTSVKCALSTHSTGGWADPRARQDISEKGKKISCSCLICPAHGIVGIRTKLPRFPCTVERQSSEPTFSSLQFLVHSFFKNKYSIQWKSNETSRNSESNSKISTEIGRNSSTDRN